VEVRDTLIVFWLGLLMAMSRRQGGRSGFSAERPDTKDGTMITPAHVFESPSLHSFSSPSC